MFKSRELRKILIALAIKKSKNKKFKKIKIPKIPKLKNTLKII